jgi:ribonuclease-3
VRRWFAGRWPEKPGRDLRKDYKTRLQERIQKQYRDRPVYTLEADRGPEHAKVFDVRLVLPDGRGFAGCGSSLKKAEQAAAQNALHVLDGRENPDAP